MPTFYCKSGSGATEYDPAHAYSSGDRMVIQLADATTNFAVARKWVWECTTGGTTNGAPSWPAAVTQDVTTVTQNGVVFTARKPGFSSGTTADWSFATIYLKYANTCGASGDTVYVSNNHAETQAAAYDCSPTTGTNIICVDDAAAPPTAVATTATVTTTGNSAISYGAAGAFTYGLNFVSGSGATGAAAENIHGKFEACSFQIATTGSTSRIVLIAITIFTNCDVKFSAAGQGINGQDGAYFAWSGGSLLPGGTSPTSLFSGGQPRPGLLENIDLTNAAAAINLLSGNNAGPTTFRNMRMPASWSGSIGGTFVSDVHVHAGNFLFNADYSGTNYTLRSSQRFGSIVQETTLVRTGGASDGTAPLSWKLVCAAGAGLFPAKFLQTPEIVKWNATTGGAVTVTVEILHDSATALTDKEVWLEVSYLGTSGAPLGTLITDAAASVLATAANQTASAATWTTTGMANPNTQKLAVTFTPQIAGFVHATVKLCKASKTVYVDPVLTVS